MIFIINSRSLRHLLVIGIDRLLFAQTWRSRSLLKDWWTKGMAIPRCPRHPIMLSTSLAVIVSRWMTILIRFAQATNLFFGSWTRRHRASRSHPRMIFCSSNPASAWSLFLASISSRGIHALGCFGHMQDLMASSMAHSQRMALSVPYMMTVAWIRLSM